MENKKPTAADMKRNWILFGLILGVAALAVAAYVMNQNARQYKGASIDPNDINPSQNFTQIDGIGDTGGLGISNGCPNSTPFLCSDGSCASTITQCDQLSQCTTNCNAVPSSFATSCIQQGGSYSCDSCGYGCEGLPSSSSSSSSGSSSGGFQICYVQSCNTLGQCVGRTQKVGIGDPCPVSQCSSDAVCGILTDPCGDGICSLGESPISCPSDCSGGTSSGGTTALSITNLNPITSPVGTATTVTITGTGFNSTTNTVRFTGTNFNADIPATVLSGGTGGQCGNRICETGETSLNCPSDCPINAAQYKCSSRFIHGQPIEFCRQCTTGETGCTSQEECSLSCGTGLLNYKDQKDSSFAEALGIPRAEALSGIPLQCGDGDTTICQSCSQMGGVGCLPNCGGSADTGSTCYECANPLDVYCKPKTIIIRPLVCDPACSAGESCIDGICISSGGGTSGGGTGTATQLQFVVPDTAPVGSYSVRVYTGAPNPRALVLSNSLPYTITPVCGNNMCEAGETTTSCPADCGNTNVNSGNGNGNGNPNSNNGNNNGGLMCDPNSIQAFGTPSTGPAPLNVQFGTTPSSTQCSNSYTCSWFYDDGPQQDVLTGCTPTHTYSSAGTYHPTVTITNNKGVTSTKTITVTVTQGAAQCELPGDVNADKKVDISDLAKMADYLSLAIPLDEPLRLCGNVAQPCNNVLDISDLSTLADYLSLAIPTLQVCSSSGSMNNNTNSSTATVTLSSLSPTSGPVGTLVTITGAGFTLSGNEVFFGNGYIPNVASTNNGTTLQFRVPGTLVPKCTLLPTTSCLLPVRITVEGAYDITVVNGQGVQGQKSLSFTVTSGTTSDTGYKCVGTTNSIPPSYICQACTIGETGCSDLNSCQTSCGASGSQFSSDTSAVYFLTQEATQTYKNDLDTLPLSAELQTLITNSGLSLQNLKDIAAGAPYARVITYTLTIPTVNIKTPVVLFYQKDKSGTLRSNGEPVTLTQPAPYTYQFKKYYARIKGTSPAKYCEVSEKAPQTCLTVNGSEKVIDDAYFDTINNRLILGNDTWVSIDGRELGLTQHLKSYFYKIETKYPLDNLMGWLCSMEYVGLPITDIQKAKACSAYQ